jgi:hypothetical protein
MGERHVIRIGVMRNLLKTGRGKNHLENAAEDRMITLN